LKDLLRYLNEHAISEKHAIVLLRTKKSKLRIKCKAWIICDRGRKPHECTDNESNEPVPIKLLNVALAPGFWTNLVCLSKFSAKGMHWDTESGRLHANGSTFCYTEPVGGHWMLENDPPDQAISVDHEVASMDCPGPELTEKTVSCEIVDSNSILIIDRVPANPEYLKADFLLTSMGKPQHLTLI
jgi:hypothetical protein